MTTQPGHAGPAGPAAAMGRAGLIAIGVSVGVTFAVAVAGPSVMEPALPGRAGVPPWSLGLHPSAYLVVALTAAGLAAGTLGLVLVLRAARGGWLVPARTLLVAGLLAAAALTLVPPIGSSDHLSYAAYGRILVTGHNPYATTPAQLAALGDPIARSVQDWSGTPSVYGPLATAIEALASLAGGNSVRLTVFMLGLANLAAFGVTGLLLYRMTREHPARQLRAALLWTCNPLLLQVLVAGAHVDSQAVVFAVAAVAVVSTPRQRAHGPRRGPKGGHGPRRGPKGGLGGWVRPGAGGSWGVVPPASTAGGSWGVVPPASTAGGSWGSSPRLAAGGSWGVVPPASTAGILVGLGFAVKVTAALAGLGLAAALVILLGRRWRQYWLPLAALIAGFAVTAGVAVAIGGSAMLRQSSRASEMVSLGSPWRVVRTLIQLVVRGAAATDIVKAGALVLAVVLTVLLIRALPGIRPGMAAGQGARAYGPAAAGVAFALVLAWLFAWPYVLPWYDALAWALLPLVPGASVPVVEAITWLLLARTAALGFGYLPARATDVTMPSGLAWLQPVIRQGVTPVALAVGTVWLVALTVRAGRCARWVQADAPPAVSQTRTREARTT